MNKVAFCAACVLAAIAAPAAARNPEVAAAEGQPSAGLRADWMRKRCGMMVHWLYPSYRDVERWTDAFDVQSFLADFEKTGADWLIFTAGQCRGAYASPNATFERLCGPGHTPRRDLVLEIARGVKKLGKRFVVYCAAEFTKDGCDDRSMQKGLCWDDAQPDRREFERRWSSVLKEWSLRLGELCDGWWLDGCYCRNYRAGLDWRPWLEACRAGNRRSAVAFNGGANTPQEPWGPSDYFAGEISTLEVVEDVVGHMLPRTDAVRHYLLPVDGYWGAYWPWPKASWAQTENLQKERPELFDKAAMDLLMAERRFPDPIYGADRLCRFAKVAAESGAGITLNVGISPEGRLNPKSMALVSRVVDSLRREEKVATVFSPGKCEVVVAPDAPKTVLFAAEEATNFLSRVLGAPVPVATAPSAGKSSLVLGDNVWSRAAGIDVAKLPRDGFVLRMHDGCVYAAGRDAKNADPRRSIRNGSLGGGVHFERATLFAVYEFLERFAGCRFFFPGDCGEVAPRQTSFTVPGIDLTSAPYFTSRDPYMGGDGAWYDKGPEGSKNPQSGKVLHWLRLRMDTESVPCCHGQQWNMIRERFAKTHPEYFQMRKDGTRCTGTPKPGQKAHDFNQLCQSSDVWDVFYEDAKAYLTGESAESRGIPSRWNPSVFSWNANFACGKYVDVMPQDAFHECFCAACRKAYDKSSRHYATDLVWRRTAQLAQRLKDDGIDAVVSQMSYLPYGSVPSFSLPGNILVTVAQQGPWGVRNRAKFDGQISLFKAWHEKTDRRIRTWTYAHKYGRTNIPGIPIPAPRAYGEYWKAAAPYVCGGFLETEADRSIQQYFNYYVFSKIAWDPDIDVEELIADHHEKMFGAGAQAMAEFYTILEDKWIGEISGNIKETSLGPVAVVPSEYDIWTKVYSPAVIRRLGALCDRAAAAVKDGSPEAKRIAFIRQQYLDPLKETSAVYMESISVERGLKERAQRPERSILANGGFEGLAGWEPGEEGTVAFDEKVKVSGRGSVRLTARKKAEARQYLGNDFKPNEKYRVSFFLKTANIRPLVEGKGGVYVEVYDGQWQFFPTKGAYCGTMDWIFQEWEFTASEAKAHERLFFHVLLNGVEGTAWFDDIRVEKVEP